jgi:hypothetical protein
METLLNKIAIHKTAMIVEKPDGFYVISEKTGRNLGGPYPTIVEARKRLRQVEYFKRLKPSK